MYAASPPASQDTRPEACRCALCVEPFLAGTTLMVCYHCGAAVHVRCLADRMLGEAGGDASESEVIPSEGLCWAPACARRLLWSRLVKGVQAYRPRSAACSSLEDEVSEDRTTVEGGRSGDMTVDGGGPLVWRVDDSSDDEDDEGGGDALREDGGGWSGSASRDNEETEEEEEEEGESDDDEFWKLSGYSQGGRAGGVVQQTGRISPCMGESERGSGPSRLPAVGRTQGEKSRKGEHVPVVDSSDRPDSDDGDSDGDSDGVDQEGGTQQSPPRLPLADRLRLRRDG